MKTSRPLALLCAATATLLLASCAGPGGSAADTSAASASDLPASTTAPATSATTGASATASSGAPSASGAPAASPTASPATTQDAPTTSADPTTSGTAAPSASSATSAAGAGAACAGSPQLPAGIDPRVCSAKPEDARAVVAGEYGGAIMASPSGNVLCSFFDGEGGLLNCIMQKPFERLELGASGAPKTYDGDDGPGGEGLTTLAYGEVGTIGAFACASQEIGFSCWNTKTKHGLFFSKKKQLSW